MRTVLNADRTINYINNSAFIYYSIGSLYSSFVLILFISSGFCSVLPVTMGLISGGVGLSG